MSPSTLLDRTHREFTTSGVDVTDVESTPVSSVPLYARVVHDGDAVPVEHVGGDPTALRVAVNSAALFVLVFFVGLGAMAVGPLVVGFRPVVVGSGSMEPSLRVADVVLVADPRADNIAVGSVVDAVTSDGNRIHRVVEVLPDGYRTKGDANQTVDSDVLAAESITGVGVFLVPFVGLPRVWVDGGQWWQLATLIASFVVAAYFSRSVWLRSGSRSAGPPFPAEPGRVR